MSQTVTLPDEVFETLDRSAKRRGLTLVSLLRALGSALGEAAPTAADESRAATIERLFAQGRAKGLTSEQRHELERLIDEDYSAAVKRADSQIAEKARRNPIRSKRPVSRQR